MSLSALQQVRPDGVSLSWRTILRTLAFTLPALLLYGLLGPAPEAWVYERSAILSGEWWRLLTGHWVHSDLQHLLLDVGALGIISYLFDRTPLWHLFLLLVASTLTIDLWLWWQLPWLEDYCGLSGLLNALLAYGLLTAWQQRNDPVYPLIGILFVIKVISELLTGEALLTQTAWAAVPEAHAIGLACGMLYYYIFHWR